MPLPTDIVGNKKGGSPAEDEKILDLSLSTALSSGGGYVKNFVESGGGEDNLQGMICRWVSERVLIWWKDCQV